MIACQVSWHDLEHTKLVQADYIAVNLDSLDGDRNIHPIVFRVCEAHAHMVMHEIRPLWIVARIPPVIKDFDSFTQYLRSLKQ